MDEKPQTTSEMRRAVIGYSRELRRLNASTEQDFLSLGRSLGEVSSEAHSVSALVASVVDLVKNEDLDRDTANLRGLYDLIDDHFRQFQVELKGGGDALHRMGHVVEDAHRPLLAFRRIVKHLRMLSVSTRIENARLASRDNSFDILAQNVESLSITIAEKSEAFFGGLTSLTGIIGEATVKLGSTGAFMDEHTGLMLRNLSSNLSMLSEKGSLSRSTATSLRIGSDQVSADISEVVSSLQFHDITRQQIEHVADIFEEIGAGRGEGDGASVSTDGLMHVIGLQIRQLKHAKNELVSAIERVTANLSRIASLLARMSGDAATLISITGDGGKSFLSELKNSLSVVMDSFVANEETGRSLSAAVRSVTGMVEKLTAFVADIEDIGSEIELIALNAQIKASRTAADGGPLGVLAEAIRNLSDDAGSQTLIMTDALKKIRNVAHELSGLGRDEESAGGTTGPIKERIGGFLEALAQSQQHLVLHLDDLNGRSIGLTGAIEASIRKIGAHNMAKEVIEGIDEDARKRLPFASNEGGSGEEKKNAYLELVADRYTMDQERHVHRSYLSVTPDQPAGLSGNSDFGDNVELF